MERPAGAHCKKSGAKRQRRQVGRFSGAYHRQRFETLQHASRVIGDWIQFYNQRRPHQALKMKTPSQAYAQVLSCAGTAGS
ncbi:integrase core domain-containing protein [Aeromonas veronii]|uniref:integrase core domain-containing protein n=1 Tax=Aeromonas veronii TaxID=654 RepID=UPI003D1AC53E